jgi:hypothetical protein
MRSKLLVMCLLLPFTMLGCADYGDGPFDDSASARSASGAVISTPELQWLRQFGGEPSVIGPAVSSDTARAVAADGSVYVVGSTTGALPGQIGDRRPDAYVRKYDAAGNEVWTRQLQLAEIEEGTDVAVDASGVYVAGVSTFASARFGSEPRGFVSRFNADGDEIWTRIFTIDGSAHTRVHGIALDSSGVYVAGEVGASDDGRESPEPLDAFARKYDRAGTVVWTNRFGTAGNDSASSVAISSGGIFVAGYTDAAFSGQTSAGMRDAFVRRFDSAGAAQWTEQFGTAQDDAANDIAGFGAFVYAAGTTAGALPGQTSAGGMDGFLSKLAADGSSTAWTRQFGTAASDEANAVDANADGAVVAGTTAGGMDGELSAGGLDSFARQIAPNGDHLWTFQLGSAANDWGFGVSVDGDSVYVAGSTDGAMPGASNNGGRDAYINKLGEAADDGDGDGDGNGDGGDHGDGDDGGDDEVCTTIEGDLIINQPSDTARTDGIDGCFDVTGGVFVQNTSGIVDLSFLAGLRNVGGYLAITDNADLVSLDGLEGVESIGVGLVIEGNDSLRRIDSLVSLHTVVGPLHIFGNPALELIDFRDLEDAGPVILAGNDALTRAGLCALQSANGLRIENNDALVSTCLDSLQLVDGTLRVAYNQSLAGLDLPSLTQINRDLIILHNVSLPTCEAEEIVQSVGASNIGGAIVIAENDDSGVCL